MSPSRAEDEERLGGQPRLLHSRTKVTRSDVSHQVDVAALVPPRPEAEANRL